MINPDNLAASLDKDELDKIGNTCVEEYDADVGSRIDFDKRRANWMKLFSGFRDPKNFPWANCSNTHMPLMAYACLQFQARAYEALLPSKNIAKCYTVDGAYIDASKRAEAYLNYQLTMGISGWEEDMDSALMYLPIMGSVYKKTFYDPIKKVVLSKMVGVDEFVTTYRCKRIDDAPRKTQIIHMEINDIRIRMKKGIFIEADIPMEANSEMTNTPMPEYREQVNKINDQSEPTVEFKTTRMIIEQHRLLDINYDPIENKFLDKDDIQYPYIVWVDYETKKVLRIISRLYYDEDVKDFRTAEYFTAYPFIPNPESHYAFGFGHLVDHINETADTILNQLIDAGTLSNIMGGFTLKRMNPEATRGDMSFTMGEFKEADFLTDDVRKAVMPFNFKPPSNVLFTLLGLLQTYVKELTSTADWMAGALPPSDTAATTVLAVIEQGLKVFSTIQKRCHRSLGEELAKIFAMNRMYMDENVYFAVQDSTSREFQTLQSGKEDFSSLIEVVPVSDPNITSKAEKMIKAQQLLQDVRTNPLTANDKMAQYYATREYYEALGVPNIDLILKEPEPPQPKDIPPVEENALFIKEQNSDVLPKQNHGEHYDIHTDFLESPIWSQYITPLGKKITETHMREHLAYAYMQQSEAQKLQFQQMIGGTNGQGVGGGMVERPGNKGIFGTPESQEASPAGADVNTVGAFPGTNP